MSDHYRTLGVLPTASQDEIRAAYARQRERLEGQGQAEGAINPGLADQLSMLDEALAILSEPGRRADYDRSLSGPNNSNTQLTAAAPGTLVAPQMSGQAAYVPCPYCGAPNPAQASICSACGKQISRSCPNCGQTILLTQPVCSRCNTVIKEYDMQRYGEASMVGQRIEADRQAAEIRISKANDIDRVRGVQTVIFWLVSCTICIGLTILAVLAYNHFLYVNR